MRQSTHVSMLRRKQPTQSITGYEFKTIILAMRNMLGLRPVFQIVGIKQSITLDESMTRGRNVRTYAF
jgi:hypothetical protein